MVVVAGPSSVYVDEPGNEGITGTVTLATSHAAIHVWDKQEPAFFQFDIYSCPIFSAHEVLEHVNEFDLVSYEYMYIDRNEEMKVVEHVRS
jgi:S-adenosylmethionine/arginine decarboxylase-like enzyme